MQSAMPAVEGFVQALRQRDLAGAALHEDVLYEGPLMGEPLRGRKNLVRFLGAYLQGLREVEVIRHIADGEFVASHLRIETMFASFPMVYIFHVESDQIVEVRAFYDPRAFLEGLGGT
jgi:limonene-1,2-epoxide hydrolase